MIKMKIHNYEEINFHLNNYTISGFNLVKSTGEEMSKKRIENL